MPVSAEETEGAVPAVNALAELCVDETDGAECAVAAVAAVPVALRALAAEGQTDSTPRCAHRTSVGHVTVLA